MSGLDVMLSACAVLTVVSALVAVTSTRVVHAALWLVVALGAMAGVYLVLGAEVVALVQVLVYVGSVVVLVLFALMLTRAPTGASTDLDSPRPVKVLAAVVGLATAVLVAGALLAGGAQTSVRLPERGTAGALGEVVFASWVLPFELLSVLLLAALVAAVAVSRGSDSDHDTDDRVDPP